jgi:hypothetical protein
LLQQLFGAQARVAQLVSWDLNKIKPRSSATESRGGAMYDGLFFTEQLNLRSEWPRDLHVKAVLIPRTWG